MARPALWLWFGVLAALAILIGLVAESRWVDAADRALALPLLLIERDDPPALIAFMQGVSWLGGGVVRWVLALLACAALWRWSGRRAAWLLLATAVAANLTSTLLKLLFARPRPDMIAHLDHVTNHSYPSGHAISVAAVVLGFAFLAPRSWRWAALWFAVTAIILTSLSRVMLGVHWPSDVVGGTLLGAAIALVVAQSPHADGTGRPRH